MLADLAKGKMRARIPALTEALTGHFDGDHARLARSMLHRLELLRTIPGVGEKVAQVILAETGGDMSRFPSAAHLAAWAGSAGDL